MTALTHFTETANCYHRSFYANSMLITFFAENWFTPSCTGKHLLGKLNNVVPYRVTYCITKFQGIEIVKSEEEKANTKQDLNSPTLVSRREHSTTSLQPRLSQAIHRTFLNNIRQKCIVEIDQWFPLTVDK